MGKLFCIMGKSSSGKDTLYRMLTDAGMEGLEKVVPYTTRPQREGETNGREYFFVKEEDYRRMCREGKVIEARSYDTVYGVWTYFTAADEQMDLARASFLVIGTLESYRKLKEYFGAEEVLPVYVEVEDGLRLLRAVEREQSQKEPGYAEVCRRFLADAQDFSEEKLAKAQIRRRFVNDDLDRCFQEIMAYIAEKK